MTPAGLPKSVQPDAASCCTISLPGIRARTSREKSRGVRCSYARSRELLPASARGSSGATPFWRNPLDQLEKCSSQADGDESIPETTAPLQDLRLFPGRFLPESRHTMNRVH